MNGLSLFSGIGGIDLALAEWVTPVLYCERERYAQGVLLSRMSEGLLPIAPIWDDVRTLHVEPGSIDIIYGGFPCQDLSAAGAGAGLAGERSGLYFEIERLIGEAKPAFVFLENVPAIRTRGLGRVVWGLSELGYDLRWTVVSAQEVGAPHIRKRWFLLAHANGMRLRQEQWPEHGKRKRPLQPNHNGKARTLANAEGASRVSTKAKADTRSIAGRGGMGPLGSREFLANANLSRQSIVQGGAVETEPHGRPELDRDGWWAIEPDVGRVADGVPLRVDRLRGLGNAVVPAQAREAFIRLSGLSVSASELRLLPRPDKNAGGRK